MDGVVKWFSEEKGYGFITDKNSKDYYFHVSDVIGTLLPEKNNKVAFDIETTLKGSRAKNINIIKKHSLKNDELDFCRNCKRKITPRMIICRGEPQRTVCPYCATVIKKFDESFIDVIITAMFYGFTSMSKMLFEFTSWALSIITNKRR